MSRRITGLAFCSLCMTGCATDAVVRPDEAGELIFNPPGPRAVISVAGPAAFQEQSLFDSIPGRSGHHAATITAFSDGELLAAWYSYVGPDELGGSAIYMSRKMRGEEAWQAPWLHVDRPAGDGNPVLYSEGEEVWLFQALVPFGWSTAHIETQRSHERGRTWSAPKVINGPLGANVRYPPVRTVSGDLLLPAYDDLLLRSLFFASVNGEDWMLRSVVCTDSPHRFIQPSVARLESGRLLAVARNSGGSWLWVTASDDHGRGWSPPRDSGFANPASAACLLRLSSGRLVLLFNDSPAQRRPLSVTMSADEGRTWSAAKVLASGDSTYSYPAATETSDGMIHALYSRGRESIRHASFNEAWIVAP